MEEKQNKEIRGKKPEIIKKPNLVSKEETGRIIRIMQTDVPGNKNIYAGLTRIKGISWAISNAICLKAEFDKKRKIESLSKEEIQKIEEIVKEGNFPKYLLNRRNDFSTGKDSHVFGSNLDISREMDIKRLKKIRSWRGWRHALGQPTRGQSTKAHFRANRKRGVGMKVKKPAASAPSGGKE